VEQAGTGAYQMSREHRVSVSESSLVSITGGKLTTHRRMARDTVEAVARRLGLPEADNQAAAQRASKLPLEEAPIPAAGADALGEATLAHLHSAYGARWGHVAALALQVPGLEQRLTPALPYLKAELAFAVQHEMALTLSDVLIRRLHVIHEDPRQGLDLAAPVAESLASLLGWSAEETGRQVAAYEHQVALTRRWREG
jgi:glycerol-3-phosphate dehydrogenase